MKRLIFPIFFLILIFGFNQVDKRPKKQIENEHIELNWEIGPKDTLSYETVMTEIGESQLDFQGLFGKATV